MKVRLAGRESVSGNHREIPGTMRQWIHPILLMVVLMEETPEALPDCRDPEVRSAEKERVTVSPRGSRISA